MPTVPRTELQVALGSPSPPHFPHPSHPDSHRDLPVHSAPSTNTKSALRKHSGCMARPPLSQPGLSLGAWGYRRAPRVPELQTPGST